MVVYISTKFHKYILGGIKVIERARLSSEKFQRAIIPYNILVVLRFLFSAHRPMMVYICTKFHLERYQNYGADMKS